MCPACIASAAWMAGSVMSTGGVAALAVKMVRGEARGKKSGSKNNSSQHSLTTVTERRNDDGNNDNERDGTGSSGAAS